MDACLGVTVDGLWREGLPLRMSRRSGGNTLFNYFTKSPSAAATAPPSSPATPSIKNTPPPSKKSKLSVQDTSKNGEGSDTDDDIRPVSSQRKRNRLPSDSDDDCANNENIDKNNTGSKLEASFKFESKSPLNKSKILATPPKKKKSNDDSRSEVLESPKAAPALENEGDWVHLKLDWLKPENIKDANKRKMDHPDYDPRTLYVPKDFMDKQSPGHKQWWEIKAAHYDCVLFFKVGKFYELYHMDATVGVNELGFMYMKGDFAHSGFPESAYSRMSSTLVQKGFRVAKVEQTETPDMLQERMKQSRGGVKDKVVRREVCQITCKGVEVCGLQYNGPPNPEANYMFALCEQDLKNGRSKYGVCFIDTSLGIFHIGQFEDDRHSSRILTTLAHYPPAIILYERGSISDRTNVVLKMCQSTRKEALNQSQFWKSAQTLKTLAEKYYGTESGVNWPDGLKPMLSKDCTLGLTPAEDCDMAIRSLGACVWYLTDCLLDIQIMEMSNFVQYAPPDTYAVPTAKSELPTNMMLDAMTLTNLRILGEDNSLYSRLNHCVTPMGKRLLMQWICSPSCNLDVIRERQNAISYLLNNQHIVNDTVAILKALPDMERLFTKIHCLGNLKRAKNHPDSRAILYEEKAYSKRKVLEFISILNGFQSALDVVKLFGDCDSTLLKRLTQFGPDGQYPDYGKVLDFFKNAFDHELASKEGTMLPDKGVDEEYDNVLIEIKNIESELADYLKTQERYFNCKVNYFGTDKKRYQLEVTESKANRAGRDYQLEGQRKGYKRFSTEQTKEFLSRMIEAENLKRDVLKDLSRRIFEKFTHSHSLWRKAINSISTLDVLISLSQHARLQSGDVCVPDVRITQPGEKPMVSVKDGRHPCMPCSVDFIPNDTFINTNGVSSLMLLTGPNMGGKSTLMRQVGIITIMTQIGCHVPASECSLSIVDRIFTRLGAHDDIMTGQSTFLVELSETAVILKHASIHSLVLLDELGRGTSTYDGTAIAAAVVNELSQRGCNTIFSTHYHTLVEDFRKNPNISLAHMACMVETDESDDVEAATQETVTFLYKLSSGACPKSYGFNAARLAGIAKELTQKAHVKAAEMEKKTNAVALFKKLGSAQNNPVDLKKLLIACKKLKL